MAEKARSKNFPAFGLGEAIDKAKQLYQRDGKAAVDAAVAVQAWGYKGINGASLRALGGVRQYGLLESSGTKIVRVTPQALTIILEPEDSAERAVAIREAAYAPAMFRELREYYPDSLPSDPAIVSWLVRTHNFSEDAAKGLIASYRDTLALVDRLTKTDIGPDGGGREEKPKQVRTMFGLMDPPERKPPPPPGGAMEFKWWLSGDVVATLTVNRALELDDIDVLSESFETAKKGLIKAAKARTGTTEAPKPPEA